MKRNSFYVRWKYLWLLVFFCFPTPFSEAAELKEGVIKELASDLAEVNRLIRTTPRYITALPSDDPFGALAAVRYAAKDVPNTLFVAGKVNDLREDIRTQVSYASGIRPSTDIAIWADAFHPDAKVFALGFRPEGEVRFAKDMEGRSFAWTTATILETATDVVEETIRAAITKLEQMKKKYAGKGLIVKGFSLSLPVLSLSVNFEFE